MLAALVCRGAIADGFMPDFSPHRAPRMAICYGDMDMARAAHAFDHEGDQDQGAHGHHSVCPYMALAAHTPVAFIVIAAPVLPAPRFQAQPLAPVILARLRTGTSPRGPPAFS
jgi:hypothetical protein